MDLLIGNVFFMILSFSLCEESGRVITSDLTVPNGSPWGVWGPKQFCPKGHANGFSVKVSKYQGPLAWEDDTGLEGIRLHCSDGTTAESSSAPRGKWKKAKWCPNGFLNAFTLQVQEPEGAGDDTAANTIQFMCSDGFTLTGRAHDWGEFGDWSPSCFHGFICGLQTRVDPPQGAGDDTGLNDVKFFCCI